MVTEEEILSYMRDAAYKPLAVKELEEAFGIIDDEDLDGFVKLVNHMEETGLIVRTRADRFGVPERMNLVRGRLQVHPKGFGFVIPADKTRQDLYIHASDRNGAMNGDSVLARIHKGFEGGRQEGEIVRILARGNEKVVGTYRDERDYGLVIPDDRRIPNDIFIPKQNIYGAKENQKVVVRITRYPEGRNSAEGEIIEVLGYKDEPGVDILSVVRKYDLPEQFPEEVQTQAEEVPGSIYQEDLERRTDLRGKKIVTIDGKEAKDLDDAVSVERLPNGNWLLGVHIADVSYYVKEGSALDQEALRRGTSVYLVDRVIPMLPQRLSNGICSLNPRADRLTMSCEMEIDLQGNVVNHSIFASVICTAERMTYQDVYQLLEGGDGSEKEELKERYAGLLDMFRDMKALALLLREKRMRRGAVDFDFPEAKILVDAQGKPMEILARERTIAEQMIEEFMLAANETVAEHFYRLEVPFLYRVHEVPDVEKITAFAEFISTFGYILRGVGNEIHPRVLQQVLKSVDGTPEETVINTVMLRSMKQARYDAQNLGHFGLAASFYTHFTSPIRRYPDLIVHRLIREILLDQKMTPERTEHWGRVLPEIAEHASVRERVAVDAEREVDDLKKAEFMLEHIGEEFEGVVSGVTSFGMFIALPNTVEGLVHVSYLTDDYYRYEEKQYALVGERTGKVFRIGDEVQVRVLQVVLDERSVDFELVGMKTRKHTAKKQPKVIVAKSGTFEKNRPSGKKGGQSRSHHTAGSKKAYGSKEQPRGVGGHVVNQTGEKKSRSKRKKKKR